MTKCFSIIFNFCQWHTWPLHYTHTVKLTTITLRELLLLLQSWHWFPYHSLWISELAYHTTICVGYTLNFFFKDVFKFTLNYSWLATYWVFAEVACPSCRTCSHLCTPVKSVSAHMHPARWKQSNKFWNNCKGLVYRTVKWWKDCLKNNGKKKYLNSLRAMVV